MLFTKLLHVELSVLIDVAGYVCPSASSAMRTTIASCALPNTPPVSVSAADAITPRMVWQLVRMAPLGFEEGFVGGGGGVSPRKK